MGRKLTQTGLTIVELLIVMVLIVILTRIILSVLVGFRSESRDTVAAKELQQHESAVLRMSLDVGKWPGGCPIGDTNDPESDVEDAVAGLTQAPPVGIYSAPCEWTVENVADWRGPYLGEDEILDPWGQSYIFDPDYYPFSDCPSETALPVVPALISLGQDGVRYTCDDTFRLLENY